MGNIFDSIKRKRTKVLMVGLDAVGKSTIANRIGAKFENETQHPRIYTPGHRTWGEIEFVCWDLGGQPKFKLLWKSYLPDSKGIVFVFNSVDKEEDRIELAKSELAWLLEQSPLAGLPLLVLANKQDLEGAMSVAEVAEKLGLDKIADRKWHVQGTTYKNKQSVIDGFDWLKKSMA